jgi:large subunit ribosomal protein L25
METIKVSVTPRETSGKGAARRLRAQAQIPAVAYGKELASMALTVSPKALIDVLATERGRNSILELELGGKTIKALLADYQYHPVIRQLLHADFYEIKDDQLIDVEVPFEAIGKAKGVVLGGVLRQVFRKLPVRCLPKDIPVRLSHDVTEIELEGHVAARDLALPEGVSIRLKPELTVLSVVGEKRRPEDEEEAAAGAAAAAPAADGAKPAS